WSRCPSTRSASSAKPASRASRPIPALLAEQLGDAADALGQVDVAERVGQPGVAGRAERLTGHDGDPRLVEDDLGQLDPVGRDAAADVAVERALEGGEAVERAL